jgi:hypothetical protein
MICSSVNRARFISPSFKGRTLNPRGGKSQWQVSLPKVPTVDAFDDKLACVVDPR